MWAIIGLGLLFLSWIIAPFLPKEGGSSKPTVIHNNIHIINNPVNYSAPSQQEPKHKDTSEEGLFGRDKLRF